MTQEGIEIELRVGTLDFALAKLISDQYHVIEFPTLLLPQDVKTGSIVKLQCKKATQSETDDEALFRTVQSSILEAFTTNTPQTPELRARNITQTSVVLEWDKIYVGSSELLSLDLYKDDQKLGSIPDPMNKTATKVSNLNIDSPYKFRLVMSTSAGKFESDILDVQTHKVSDLTGVVVCIGSLNHSSISEQDIKDTLAKLQCKPTQEHVNIDTTHFICTTEGGEDFQKAYNLSVPVVRPEWIKACEVERRLVSVREYYLSADPKPVPVQAQHAREAQPKSQPDAEEAPGETQPETQEQESHEQESQTETQEETQEETQVQEEEVPVEDSNESEIAAPSGVPEEPKEHEGPTPSEVPAEPMQPVQIVEAQPPAPKFTDRRVRIIEPDQDFPERTRPESPDTDHVPTTEPPSQEPSEESHDLSESSPQSSENVEGEEPAEESTSDSKEEPTADSKTDEPTPQSEPESVKPESESIEESDDTNEA